MTKFEQLQKAFTQQQQAAKAMKMVEDRLEAGEEFEEAILEEYEDNEVAADKVLVEVVAAHMPDEGRAALLLVYKHQPTQAIEKSIKYAHAIINNR